MKQDEQQAKPRRFQQIRQPLFAQNVPRVHQAQQQRHQRAKQRRDHVRKEDRRRAERQRFPAVLVSGHAIPQRRDKQRQKDHCQRFADREPRVYVRQPIRRQHVQRRGRSRYPSAAKHAFSRRIHARRRADVQADEQHVAHIGKARAAQPHQREGIKRIIRIENRGQRAVSVVHIRAQPCRKLPALPRIHDVFNPAEMILNVVADVQRLLKRGRVGKKHGQPDHQHPFYLCCPKPAPAHSHPNQAERQRCKQQRKGVVAASGRINPNVVNLHVRSGGKFKLKLQAGYRAVQRKLKFPFKLTGGQNHRLRLHFHAVFAVQMQGVVPVAVNKPFEPICSGGKAVSRPAAWRHAVNIPVFKAHRRAVREIHRLHLGFQNGIPGQHARGKRRRAEQRQQHDRPVGQKLSVHARFPNFLRSSTASSAASETASVIFHQRFPANHIRTLPSVPAGTRICTRLLSPVSTAISCPFSVAR